MCLLISQDSNYPDLMIHYLKHQSSVFPKEGVASDHILNIE
jgi:hypothetical protein